jgi:hypothetical protein
LLAAGGALVNSLQATGGVGANPPWRQPPINCWSPATGWVVVTLLLIGGCATRPINAPIAAFSPNQGYQILAPQHDFKDPENLVVVAFSGAGASAAAFSYGVLETLRSTEISGV